MLIKYFIIMLLMWLSFIVVFAVTVSMLVIVVVVVILLVMRIVLWTVKTRKCKFDILIIMTTSFNVTYIGIYNFILPQENNDSSEWNSVL